MECCSDSPPLYGYFLVAKIELTLASKVHYLNLPQPMYKNIEEEEKAQVKHIEIDFCSLQLDVNNIVSNVKYF